MNAYRESISFINGVHQVTDLKALRGAADRGCVFSQFQLSAYYESKKSNLLKYNSLSSQQGFLPAEVFN
jgi:hypothetical protein